MKGVELEIRKRIDADIGLKSKRRLLTIASLILLGMTLTGASVVEVNTIFLKISFSNQDGLLFLLLMSIIFLLLRYYNYAESYHSELFKSWSSRMLKQSYLWHYCHHSDSASGLIVDIQPNGAYIDDLHREGHSSYSYICKAIFRRHIRYYWDHGNNEGDASVSILKQAGIKQYLRILKFEFKYQAGSFFTHREYLDILAPYMLGVTAICSYFFNEEFHAIVAILLGTANS
jgi:hypothetical protein